MITYDVEFEHTLQDFAEAIVDCEHKTAPTQYNGIPLVRTTDIKNGRLSLNSANCVSEETFRIWSSRIEPRADDIILAREAPVGEVGFVPNNERICLGQRTTLIRIDKKKAEPRYILYLLCTQKMKHEMSIRAGGSVVPHLNVQEIRVLPIPRLPSLLEQKGIAKILGSLDDKIELNGNICSTLERASNAVFKHWFVDFEFPNEQNKPYKSSGGEMLYNEELRKEIPREWEVRPFSEIIAVNPKRELATRSLAKKVSMADLDPRQACIRSWSCEEYKSGPKFKNGDTLLARITPSLENGKTAFVSFLKDDEVGFGSTEFIVFGKKVVSSELYIFHLSTSGEIRNVAINAMTGTSGRQRVPDELFDHLPIVLPPATVLEQFERVCSSLFDRISTIAKDSEILSQIRECLLPRLMSGRVRVPVEV